ncbi:unnamed protein product (mitochondrion) [Plasmodiophora brassicae]|uniref:Uncharacterized protein n=1 Tax=Plasmodiophora brassicae TaxID=37360 RepID=A0A3P3YM14_PLABS|nr:unnamed protein product [Plasmodiophora brassicae]
MATQVPWKSALLQMSITCRCGQHFGMVGLTDHQARLCPARYRVCRSCQSRLSLDALAEHACAGRSSTSAHVASSETDLVGDQDLFLFFVQTQIGRRSSFFGLHRLLSSWRDPVRSATWLIVESQLVAPGPSFDLVSEAMLVGSDLQHEILTITMLLAKALLERRRHADATEVLRIGVRQLKSQVEIGYLECILDSFAHCTSLPVYPALWMASHMAVTPTETMRLTQRFPAGTAPSDSQVRCHRDPLDGDEIGDSLSSGQIESLIQLRLAGYSRYYSDGVNLHVIMSDADCIGYRFDRVGGLRLLVHTDMLFPFAEVPVRQPKPAWDRRPKDSFPLGTTLHDDLTEGEVQTVTGALPWVSSLYRTCRDLWLGVFPGSTIDPWEYPETIAGLTVRVEWVAAMAQHGARLLPDDTNIAVMNRWPNPCTGCVVRHSRNTPTVSGGILCSYNGQSGFLTVPTHAFYTRHPDDVDEDEPRSSGLGDWLRYAFACIGSRSRFSGRLKAKPLPGLRIYHCTMDQSLGSVVHCFDDTEAILSLRDCPNNQYDVSLLDFRAGTCPLWYHNCIAGIYGTVMTGMGDFDRVDIRQIPYFLYYDSSPLGLLILRYDGTVHAPGVPGGRMHRLHMFTVEDVPPLCKGLTFAGCCGCPIFDGQARIYGFARFYDDQRRTIACVALPPGLSLT